LLAVVLLVLGVVLSAMGALYAFDRAYVGKIYPNVSIRGVSVGELTPDEARRSLQEQFAPFLAQPLTIAYGDQTWTPTLAELGVQLEIDTAIDNAYAAGRGNGVIANLRQVAAVWENGLELPLRLTIDQPTMQAYLLGRVAEVDRPAVDAQLELDTTLINVFPASMGQQVIIDETLQEITAAVQSLTPQTIPLRTRELAPRLSDSAALDAQQQIARLLAGPIILTVENQTFEWSVSDLARLVRVERISDATGDRLLVTINEEEIVNKVQALAEATAVQGTYPRVNWNGGDLQIFREGKPGRQIDTTATLSAVLTALQAPAASRELTLAMQEAPPPVTAANIGQLGITDLLSVGRSDFSGSAPYRVTNINVGMGLLNGILLAPGDEFSFNNTVGRIDASNGFVEGYAIVQNRTQLEWGGGICQDSTTMFRAAFWAGLPITERWGHSFYISWYDRYAFGPYGDGPGMDATIYTGALDLKFVNDTGNWLLIQAFTNGNTAEVRMYGTDDGRTVTMRGPTIRDRIPAPTEPVYVAEPSRPRGSPRQSDTARGGMTIDFTRVIERDGQIIEERTFQTRFRPWPDIFEVNPADLGPDGKPIQATPVPTAEPAPVEAPPVPAEPAPQPEPEPAPAPIVEPVPVVPVPITPIEPVPEPPPSSDD
jgi:vancomycin resistance protein YoaR